MNPRRALRCLALTVSTLLFLLGGFAGCGGGDDSTGMGLVDASRDAPADVTTDGGCPAAQSACGASCVDEQSDPNNCGGCGVVCGTGTDCEQGACLAPCLAGQTRCSGRCLALETDNVNCGACGHTCSTGLVCSNGACGVACAPPLTTCEIGGSDAGADAGLDSGADAAADASAALDASADAAPDAGDASLDASASSEGGAPDAGATADAASPAVSRYCARTASDEHNCGACGVSCAAGQQCDDGVCSATCSAGQTLCSGVCRDLATDLANCGTCGTTCASGQVCSGGVCQASCGLPFTQCGSACANTASDPAHCGSCATSCAPENVKAPACSSGTCNYVGCQGGFADCDGNVANGCELATSTDVTNCGGCGVHCAGAHVSANVCAAGACGYAACQAGFADCDGSAANGCETDLTSSASCGACGNVCATGSSCSNEEQCVPGVSTISPDLGASATIPSALSFTLATAYPSAIYYTLDGSTPTLSSAHGPSPLVLANITPTNLLPVTLRWSTYDGDALSAPQSRVITEDTASQSTYNGDIAQVVRLTTAATTTTSDGPAVVASPGQTVNGSMYSLQIVDSACPGCAEVITVGTTAATSCPYFGGGGPWPGTTVNNLSFSLVAPAMPGVYYVHLASGEQYYCPNTEAEFTAAFASDTARRIGTITVR